MRTLSITAALLLAACAHSELAPRDQLHTQLQWVNRTRQLSSSLYVAPFFRDDSRRLLTVQPPAETELLVTPKGRLLPPGEVEDVLPAGTRVTVLAITFPNTWEAFTRPLLTPRERPWVELAVEGRPLKPAYVLVLRPDVKTVEDVSAELDKRLSENDVAGEVVRMSDLDRQIVREKRLVPGATARALELAFGTPALRKVFGDGASVAEDWTWRSDTQKRVAHLKDGIVTSVELPDEPRTETAAR